MNRILKTAVLLVCDILIAGISCAVAVALFIEYGKIVPQWLPANLPRVWFWFGLLIVASNTLFHLYFCAWSYAGFNEFLRLCGSAALSLAVVVALKLGGYISISGTVSVIIVACSYFLVFLSRFSLRLYGIVSNCFASKFGGNVKNVLIIGGESAVPQVLHWCSSSKDQKRRVVGLLNDDINSKGISVAGVKVLGGLDILKKAVEKYEVDEIIIALPDAPKSEIRRIYEKCKTSGCEIKIVPAYINAVDFVSGGGSIIRDMRIEDLLGRDEVELDKESLRKYICGSVVLVTGGAGSIGSEICRQVLDLGAGKLIVYDIHENGLFAMGNELSALYDRERFEIVVGSIRDTSNLDYVFSKYRPNLVFHAAAHKHVPMMEANPYEAVKNNIFGTLNVCNAAIKHGAEKFILISTDKAVNPANIMGSTKRIAELIVQQKNIEGSTKFAAVRFGNVLGSTGSVIPIFQEQIAKGGPVTVTHKDIKRYFMTIPEAVSLVLQAGSLMQGGEVFVLDMGEPIKIYDLACEMIRLAGLRPHEDIEIKITGLRPGEKMFEQLRLDNENMRKTGVNKIYILNSAAKDLSWLYEKLDKLKGMLDRNGSDELRQFMAEIIECSSKD